MAAPLDRLMTVLRYFVLIFELQTYTNINITRTHVRTAACTGRKPNGRGGTAVIAGILAAAVATNFYRNNYNDARYITGVDVSRTPRRVTTYTTAGLTSRIVNSCDVSRKRFRIFSNPGLPGFCVPTRLRTRPGFSSPALPTASSDGYCTHRPRGFFFYYVLATVKIKVLTMLVCIYVYYAATIFYVDYFVFPTYNTIQYDGPV